MSANPFDQFDPPQQAPKQTANPFDKFDPPPASAEAVNVPDAEPSSPSKQSSGYLSHKAQIVGRGLLDGTVGVLDLPNTVSNLAVGHPLYRSLAGRAGDALGLDKPDGLGDQLLEAGASAVIPGVGTVKALGAAAKGADLVKAAKAAQALRAAQGAASTALGSGTVQAASKAATGAVTGTLSADAAQNMGFGNRGQTVAGILGGGIPTAGRIGAGKVADTRALNAVTPEAAARIPAVTQDFNAYRQGAINGNSPAASAASYVKDTGLRLQQYAAALKSAGIVSDGQHAVIKNMVKQAETHKNALSRAPGSSLDQVQSMNIPDEYLNPLVDGALHLDTASQSKLLGNQSGPFQTLGTLVGGAAGTHIPGFNVGMELIGAGAGGAVLGRKIGSRVDRALGTQRTAANSQLKAANRVNSLLGQTPEPSPLEAVQGAQDSLAALPQAGAGAARGQNNAERAGAWMERELLRQHKARFPDVPVTGAAVLQARTPEDVFEATQGNYGSPAPVGPSDLGPSPAPQVSGVRSPTQARSGPPVSSVSSAGAEDQEYPAFTPMRRGGQVIVSKILAESRHPPASAQELDAAIGQASLAGLPPEDAEALKSGESTTRDVAGYVAHMVAHQRGSAPHPGNYDASAATAVKNAFESVPDPDAPPSRPPIRDPERWNSAKESYQNLVGSVSGIAAQQGNHALAARILGFGTTPRAQDKQALAASLMAEHPGYDHLFTPELLRGIE